MTAEERLGGALGSEAGTAALGPRRGPTSRGPRLVGRERELEVDRPRARDLLERAAATFDAGGAVRRRDRALEALRRLGEAGKRAAATVVPSALSPREREVAVLAARGRTAPQIALELYVGERTVESHLARIYAKLGVASKYELVQRAGELGLADRTEPVDS